MHAFSTNQIVDILHFNPSMTEADIMYKPWFLYDNGLRHERVKDSS